MVSVLDFSSITDFLQAYYQFKKDQNSSFSYTLWGRKLRDLDRSQLRQIVEGQRSLPERYLGDFLNYFEFNDPEAEHFVDLVHLSRRRGDVEQEYLLSRIQARHRDLRQSVAIEPGYRFLRDLRIPLLASLYTFEDIEKSSAALARRLDCSSEEVEAWTKDLAELGFIQKDALGQWQPTSSAFRVPLSKGMESLSHYHREVLHEAARATGLPSETRRYENCILPLSEAEYAELLKMLDVFRREVLYKFDANRLQDRRLYHLSFAVVPVSKEAGPGVSSRDRTAHDH